MSTTSPNASQPISAPAGDARASASSFQPMTDPYRAAKAMKAARAKKAATKATKVSKAAKKRA